ncbi:MAG: PDZ domain-containing protein [Phycisphaerales bacterium]|nr:PDZ domain-containing protein [Phycisphaerales bacterium]
MKVHTLVPAAVVAVAAVLVLVVTPRIVRESTHARVEAEMVAAKSRLSKTTVLEELNQATRDIASVVEPSVVSLHATGLQAARSGTRSFTTAGSGWVYDIDGHIVTNAHVVDGASRIEAQLSTGQIVQAELIGLDLKTDIAVLRIGSEDLTPAQRSLDIPTQGDMVFAFGSPFEFRFSMSAGIVSGIGRTAGLSDVDYENFIQVDAAINPGNSGGPLTDVYGRVIGMNTAIATGRGNSLGQGQFGGIGLAIPMDIIEFVVAQLIEKGEVEKGFSGIAVQPVAAIIPPQMRDPLFRCIVERYEAAGSVITRIVPDSPADRAGLRIGDVIVSIDGTRATEPERVYSLIGTRAPGQALQFEVWRPVPEENRGETLQFDVLLVKRDPRIEAGAIAETLRNFGFERLVTATKEACGARGAAFRRGVLVDAITLKSQFDGVIPPGAVITAVGGHAIGSVEEFYVRLGRSYEMHRGLGRMSTVLTVAFPDGTQSDFEIPLR